MTRSSPRRYAHALALVMLAATPTLGVAQQPIVSDRPGIGSGAAIVPYKAIQVELGFEFMSTEIGENYSFGQGLIRIGAPGFEFELFLNSYFVTRGSFDDIVLDDEGLQDLAVGAKVPLLKGAGDRLDLSFQTIVQFPSGSDGVTDDGWVPTGILLADIGLNDRFSVSVNTGYRVGRGQVPDAFTLFLTPAVSLSDRVGTYAGWAGTFGESPDTHFAEAGFTYLPALDVQLDVNGGWDVDRNEYFLGLGVALRRRH